MTRVALAHDYLTQRGGAERVALAMTRVFPGAPIHTSVYAPPQTFPDFADVDVRVSRLQSFPVLRRDPRLAMPLLASVWDATTVTDVDAVVVSSSGWAHAARVPAATAKVVYCHNPARWLYQPDDYFTDPVQRAAFAPLRQALVRWDQRAARGADVYLANSSVVAQRIEATYGRPAQVLHPPVAIDVAGRQLAVDGVAPGYWLTVARGRGYKNVDAVRQAVLALPGERLVVVGSPPPGTPTDPRVRWLGVVSDAELRWLYAHARALVSVSREDFGLTPLEANAFGTPVAVLRAGGFLDSLAEGVSGAWIEAPTADAVARTLAGFPTLDPDGVRRHAAGFGEAAFGARLRAVVEEAVEARRARLGTRAADAGDRMPTPRAGS